MSHSIQCRCGRVRGTVLAPARAIRGICYCKDCQAYARLLGNAETVLDAHGGTCVVATRAGSITFSAGQELLACLTLTAGGPLRWYARCCNTPIANTARRRTLSYVGLVHTALGDAAAQEASFGPPRLWLNTRSAQGEPNVVARSPLLVAPGFALGLIWDRVSGRYRRTPFFTTAGEPIATPGAPTQAERDAAYGG
ncbi:DUF6151 family protein [Chitinolyticbacter albus]|uniref:DUF6151 family protein n=1 Tax=Chitinolyticbacter albus TaxID=2961951 RepID=UPI00210B4C73|nr:DUF6151 family protein [Chitinolyticbacter albus]